MKGDTVWLIDCGELRRVKTDKVQPYSIVEEEVNKTETENKNSEKISSSEDDSKGPKTRSKTKDVTFNKNVATKFIDLVDFVIEEKEREQYGDIYEKEDSDKERFKSREDMQLDKVSTYYWKEEEQCWNRDIYTIHDKRSWIARSG